MSTKLLNYNGDRPIFQGFFFEDNDKEKLKKLSNTYIKSRKIRNTKGKQLTLILVQAKRLVILSPFLLFFM